MMSNVEHSILPHQPIDFRRTTWLTAISPEIQIFDQVNFDPGREFACFSYILKFHESKHLPW